MADQEDLASEIARALRVYARSVRSGADGRSCLLDVAAAIELAVSGSVDEESTDPDIICGLAIASLLSEAQRGWNWAANEEKSEVNNDG